MLLKDTIIFSGVKLPVLWAALRSYTLFLSSLNFCILMAWCVVQV